MPSTSYRQRRNRACGTPTRTVSVAGGGRGWIPVMVFWLSGLFLFVSCIAESVESPVLSSQTIQFAVSPATYADGETRAVLSGSYLPEDSLVGIFAYSYTSSADWSDTPDILNNTKGIVREAPENGTSPQVVTISGTSDIYYVTGRKHAFYSYYPYRSTLTAADPVWKGNLFTDLEDNDTQTDWLWAGPVTGVEVSPTPVPLTYSHAMTMVSIGVAKKKEVNATLKMESLTLTTSSSQKFTFDVSTGMVTSVTGDGAQYTESLSSLDEDKKELSYVVVPSLEGTETIAKTVVSKILLLPASEITKLSFRINGEDFATPDAWVGFDASTGGKYRFVSIVIDVDTVTIQLGGQDWKGDDEIDLSGGEITFAIGAKSWNYDPATDVDMTQSTITFSVGAKGWSDSGTPITVPKKEK